MKQFLNLKENKKRKKKKQKQLGRTEKLHGGIFKPKLSIITLNKNGLKLMKR